MYLLVGESELPIVVQIFASDTLPDSKALTTLTTMDALCARTVMMQKRNSMDFPVPDYESEHSINSQQMKPKDIRRNIPLEIKEISRDIQMRSKQDIIKRPEFLSKQHQLKTSALKKQEEKEKFESNELLQKLKSRSEQIDQEMEIEKEKQQSHEFQKVQLKPKKMPIPTPTK